MYVYCLILFRVFSENNVPNITLQEDSNIVDGSWRVQVDVVRQITLVAMDVDGDDVTFSLTNDSSIMLPEGIMIDNG